MHNFLLPACLSFGVSLLLTWLMIHAGRYFGVIDAPGDRKMHAEPTPCIGGVALFIAFLVGSLSCLDISMPLKGVVYGASLIFFMGLLDDLSHLPAWLRLLGQVASVGVLLAFGVRIQLTSLFWLDALITGLWIIGITNAFNFLDNMDWLATGLTITSSLAFFIIANLSGDRWLGFLAISLAGAAVGFAYYNAPPARIFMGDSGATFLGFVLASIGVLGEWSQGSRAIAVTIPLLILYIPIFDMVLITFLRTREGKVHTVREWIEYAGKDHISHRLVALGLSPLRAVLFIIYANLILGGIAVLTYRFSMMFVAAIALCCTVLISLFIIRSLHGRYLT